MSKIIAFFFTVSTNFLRYEGLGDDGKNPTYSFTYQDDKNQIPLENSFSNSTGIRSRCQLQFGVKYLFNQMIVVHKKMSWRKGHSIFLLIHFSKIEYTNSSERLQSATIINYNNFYTLRPLTKNEPFTSSALRRPKLSNALISGEVEIMDSAWVLLSSHLEEPKFHLTKYDFLQ